jgi:uncharacterized protein involved in outer membrane biogenesis
MKKWVKIVVWLLAGVIVLILIGYAVIVSYKKEILAELNQEISNSVNGQVEIGDLKITLLNDFPNLSLSLRNVYLRGPRYDQYKQDFLTAEIIDLNVRPFKLLLKEVSIKSIHVQNGQISIFRTKDNYINLDIFKNTDSTTTDTTKAVSGKSLDITFDKINFKNVHVAYYDSLKEKSFAAKFGEVENLLVCTDSSLQCNVLGDIKFDGLMFNAAKGSFLKNKSTQANWNLEFIQTSKKLIIEKSTLKLEKSTINLSGALQFLLPGGNFSIRIQSDKLNYPEGLTVINEQLRKSLSKFSISKPVVIDVHLKGELGPGGTPDVDVSFRLKKADVTWNKLDMQSATLNGFFTNHKDENLPSDDRNSDIKLDSIVGIIRALPFTGKASFNDLTDPFLNLDVVFDSELRNINQEFDTTRIKFVAGHFISKVRFQGKLNEYFDESVTRYHGTLQGETEVKDGKLLYLSKNMVLDRINASFGFTERKFTINKILLRLNKNSVAMDGSITGFIPFFMVPEKQGKVLLNVYSPSLDFTGIVTKPKKSIEELSEANKLARDDKETRDKKKVSDLLDQLYKKVEFDVSFKIDKLKSNEIIGTGISGKVVLADNTLKAHNVNMTLAGGTMELSSTVYNLEDEENPFALNANVQHADIKEFFRMFNNFKQTAIRSEHIDGKLSAAINITAAIDDNFDVMMPRLQGTVDLNVKEGRIRDFPPLENMSNFLFKKRDFTDVSFGEVIASFNIRGTELDVSRMEVQSTVLTLFLKGRFSLKDSTDLSIQVPLSNLKKRDKDFVPQNVGTDSKVGLSVFLRASQGKEGKTVIAFDSFGKEEKKRKSKKK